jgi:hypothetical protein
MDYDFAVGIDQGGIAIELEGFSDDTDCLALDVRGVLMRRRRRRRRRYR